MFKIDDLSDITSDQIDLGGLIHRLTLAELTEKAPEVLQTLQRAMTSHGETSTHLFSSYFAQVDQLRSQGVISPFSALQEQAIDILKPSQR